MPLFDLASEDDLSGFVPLWEVKIENRIYKLFSGNRIMVYKEGSATPDYTIDKNGCTCKAAQYGNANCVHRQTIVWTGDGEEAGFIEQTKEVYDSSNSSTDNILDIL